MVGGWRNMGWSLTIRMKMEMLRYLMLKVPDIKFHSVLLCSVPFNLGGGRKVIKGLKSGERKVDISKPLSRPILISCCQESHRLSPNIRLFPSSC